MKRAALYLRVSTDEQTAENQRPELERIAALRGYQVESTYSETVSGAARKLPELERLMRDAQRHKLDVVMVWALDRLGRRMGEVVAKVLELERLGVDLVSVQEPWLDTGGPVRSLLVSVFAWVAEQERGRLVERTNAGLARARAKGVILGRPVRNVNPHALELALGEGLSIRQAARRLGMGASTLYRELERRRELGLEVPKTGRKKRARKRPKSDGSRSSP
jgi:DNA invertase Pin-like site-specific DNA recombinase